jgi:hypothetical protein
VVPARSSGGWIVVGSSSEAVCEVVDSTVWDVAAAPLSSRSVVASFWLTSFVPGSGWPTVRDVHVRDSNQSRPQVPE